MGYFGSISRFGCFLQPCQSAKLNIIMMLDSSSPWSTSCCGNEILWQPILRDHEKVSDFGETKSIISIYECLKITIAKGGRGYFKQPSVVMGKAPGTLQLFTHCSTTDGLIYSCTYKTVHHLPWTKSKRVY